MAIVGRDSDKTPNYGLGGQAQINYRKFNVPDILGGIGSALNEQGTRIYKKAKIEQAREQGFLDQENAEELQRVTGFLGLDNEVSNAYNQASELRFMLTKEQQLLEFRATSMQSQIANPDPDRMRQDWDKFKDSWMGDVPTTVRMQMEQMFQKNFLPEYKNVLAGTVRKQITETSQMAHARINSLIEEALVMVANENDIGMPDVLANAADKINEAHNINERLHAEGLIDFETYEKTRLTLEFNQNKANTTLEYWNQRATGNSDEFIESLTQPDGPLNHITMDQRLQIQSHLKKIDTQTNSTDREANKEAKNAIDNAMFQILNDGSTELNWREPAIILYGEDSFDFRKLEAQEDQAIRGHSVISRVPLLDMEDLQNSLESLRPSRTDEFYVDRMKMFEATAGAIANKLKDMSTDPAPHVAAYLQSIGVEGTMEDILKFQQEQGYDKTFGYISVLPNESAAQLAGTINDAASANPFAAAQQLNDLINTMVLEQSISPELENAAKYLINKDLVRNGLNVNIAMSRMFNSYENSRAFATASMMDRSDINQLKDPHTGTIDLTNARSSVQKLVAPYRNAIMSSDTGFNLTNTQDFVKFQENILNTAVLLSAKNGKSIEQNTQILLEDFLSNYEISDSYLIPRNLLPSTNINETIQETRFILDNKRVSWDLLQDIDFIGTDPTMQTTASEIRNIYDRGHWVNTGDNTGVIFVDSETSMPIGQRFIDENGNIRIEPIIYNWSELAERGEEYWARGQQTRQRIREGAYDLALNQAIISDKGGVILDDDEPYTREIPETVWSDFAEPPSAELARLENMALAPVSRDSFATRFINWLENSGIINLTRTNQPMQSLDQVNFVNNELKMGTPQVTDSLIRMFVTNNEFSAEPYIEDGVQKIGYGTIISEDMGTISAAKAIEMLRDDIGKSVEFVSNSITAGLTQREYDGLVYLTMALGDDAITNSGIIEQINRGNRSKAQTIYNNLRSNLGSRPDPVEPNVTPLTGNVPQMMTQASEQVGIPQNNLHAILGIETANFDATARNAESSAQGLGQFIDSTWERLGNKVDWKYGRDRNDPQTSIMMTAELVKENAEWYENRYGSYPTPLDSYLMHFFGLGNAAIFFGASKSTIATTLALRNRDGVIAANRNIFFDRAGRPRTVGQIEKMFRDRIKARTGIT